MTTSARSLVVSALFALVAVGCTPEDKSSGPDACFMEGCGNAPAPAKKQHVTKGRISATVTVQQAQQQPGPVVAPAAPIIQVGFVEEEAQGFVHEVLANGSEVDVTQEWTIGDASALAIIDADSDEDPKPMAARSGTTHNQQVADDDQLDDVPNSHLVAIR